MGEAHKDDQADRADVAEPGPLGAESDGPAPAVVHSPMSEHLSVSSAGQLLASIIEYLPDATFVIDNDERLVAWNRACETMTGVSKESLPFNAGALTAAVRAVLDGRAPGGIGDKGT